MEAVIPLAAAPPAPAKTTQQEQSLEGIVASPLRVDLIIRRQFFKHEEYYVIKDPLALTYYRLQPEEAYILGLLDGKRTFGEISKIFAARYPNSDRPLMEMAAFINQLGASGLLNVNAKRFVDNARRTPVGNLLVLWAKVISGVLFLKIPLLDPSPWLGKLAHSIRFVWTKWFVGAALLLFAWTFGLLVFNSHLFSIQRIDFFSSTNLLLIWVVIILIKTCHEFGHATTCRYFGGEVHEMGFCLMCFTPCGYVDASDAWMMRHKRHKLFVTIAGVFTELIIACFAAHLWLVMPDGLGRSLAFNAMLVASVNTIVFNANPLMRFDGYYVACDVLEIPNLRSKAIAYCSFHLQRIFLGYRNLNQERLFEQDSNGKAFLIYAIFAYAYMAFVIYGLTQVFARVLQPIGLSDFGLVVGFFVEGSFLAFPFIKVFMDSFKPGTHIVKEGSTLRRASITLGALALIAAISFFVPSHFVVSQQAVVVADSSEMVSSSVSGVIKQIHVRTGQWVVPGDLLVTLESGEVRADLAIREAELAGARLRVGAMPYEKSWAASEAGASSAKTLEVAEAAYAHAASDAAQLEVRSKVAGYVLTPDVQHLVGAFIPSQRPIFRVGDTRRLRLIVPLTENQAQLVGAGDRVIGRWRGDASSFETTLLTVSSQPARPEEIHQAMLSYFGGPAPLQAAQASTADKMHFPIFFASALLPAQSDVVIEGLRVKVSIEGHPTTLAHRWWRWFLSLWSIH